MPKVVMFSVFFPSVSSSCAVWAHPNPHQEHSNAATIFFMIAPYRWWDKLYPEPLFLLRPVLVRILLRWNWNPRRPFQPSLSRLLVQGEYRPAPYRPGLRIARGGEGDPPRHQRPQRLHIDFQAAEQAELHVRSARIPELGASAHQFHVPRFDQRVDFRHGRIGAELDSPYRAHLDASIVDRRAGFQGSETTGAQNDLQPVGLQRRLRAFHADKVRFPTAGTRQRLNVRTGNDRSQVGDVLKLGSETHDPEHRSFPGNRGGRAQQARLDHHVAQIVAQTHRLHLADPHTAVLDRRSTGLEAAAVLESNRDRRTELPDLVKDEISRHQCSNRGNDPHDRKAPPASLHLRPGHFADGLRLVAGFGILLRIGHGSCSFLSQIEAGSKLAEARMVNTTMAVNAMSPRPGSTVASCPNFTKATSIARRNTSSIAHGAIASMVLKIKVRSCRQYSDLNFVTTTRKNSPSSLRSGTRMLARKTIVATGH